MGVYVRGMEMPKSCADCELAKHFDGYNENDCPFNSFSYYDCPLVPVPPHGRLADLDKIENEIAQLPPENYTTGGIRLVLDYAPTIIPASED